MLYPAVIGFVLWMLTESDQVGGAAVMRLLFYCCILGAGGETDHAVGFADQPGHLLRGLCPFQRGVGHPVPGKVEAAGGGASIQVGDAGHAFWVDRGAPASV